MRPGGIFYALIQCLFWVSAHKISKESRAFESVNTTIHLECLSSLAKLHTQSHTFECDIKTFSLHLFMYGSGSCERKQLWWIITNSIQCKIEKVLCVNGSVCVCSCVLERLFYSSVTETIAIITRNNLKQSFISLYSTKRLCDCVCWTIELYWLLFYSSEMGNGIFLSSSLSLFISFGLQIQAIFTVRFCLLRTLTLFSKH